MIVGTVAVNLFGKKNILGSCLFLRGVACNSLFKSCQDLLSFAQEPVLGSIVQYYELWVFNKELTMMNEDEFVKYLVASSSAKYYLFIILDH